MTKGRLRVDAQDLAEALEGRGMEGDWLLNLETGEVLFVSDEELREDEEEIYENDERYMPIFPLESSDSFQIMEDFVEDLSEGEPKRALARALRLPKPFRSFKDTLLDFPAMREAWFKFHDDQMLVIAQEWLEENVPEAQLIQG